MAPAVLTQLPSPIPSTLPSPKNTPRNTAAPRSIFPDGIRTSGQHPPLYDLLQPYLAFPRQIIDQRTVWRAEDYADNPEKWVHRFSPAETRELGTAADAFIASGEPLTAISKENFRLSAGAQDAGGLELTLGALRKDLLNGKGFILFKGFPSDEWGPHKSAVAYMGLGARLGYFLSQNGRGHVLGHVKDVGDDPTQTDRVRIYRTAAKQFFHNDNGDLVGLLCLHRAQQGGESDIVSTHHVWNTLQREHPDVAALLTEPIWYFDRKGETSQGQEEWIRQPIFYLERGDDDDDENNDKDEERGHVTTTTTTATTATTTAAQPRPQRRVFAKWDPYYVRSLRRFSDAGLVPPLSPEQERAAQVLQDTCERLALHMVLEVGDVQFLSDAHVLHARTAYTDFAPPAPRRHLLRLWLSTPVAEGGWRLPFPDNLEKKRGGIQVDDTPPKAPLEAE